MFVLSLSDLSREGLETLPQARQFSFTAEGTGMEQVGDSRYTLARKLVSALSSLIPAGREGDLPRPASEGLPGLARHRVGALQVGDFSVGF